MLGLCTIHGDRGRPTCASHHVAPVALWYFARISDVCTFVLESVHIVYSLINISVCLKVVSGKQFWNLCVYLLICVLEIFTNSWL